MMTSKQGTVSEAFVWVFLPGEVKPVVAGRIENIRNYYYFNYGKRYLERVNGEQSSISLYEVELPLKRGRLSLLNGLIMPGCIRDAAPDAWGRRVILNKKFGVKGKDADTEQLDEITYLLESGSDRIGALDFQLSSEDYVPREQGATSLEELLESAGRIERGEPLSDNLDLALFYGSAIGGTRPKALIGDDDKKYVAKFPDSSDTRNVEKAEFIAMRLAKLAGLNVAPVQIVKSSGKDVLLIERFDRIKTSEGWQRKQMLSALTLFGMDEMMARYASYEELAEIIRLKFTEPKETLKELYSRLVFNILCGNADDHARNHAAFWDGENLTLTPAYDICPQTRTGMEAGQIMKILGGRNASQLILCFEAASKFLLSQDEAREIAEVQKSIIEKNWDVVCDESEISEVEKNSLWKRQFLNDYAFYGL
jgi:serine/threonine-protein kinase HipA